MKHIEDFLRQTMGLHAATVGGTSVEQAVQARMTALGLSRTEDYLKILRGSRDEWHALIELVVVTETWFFRDREPFRAFVNLVRCEWLPAHSSGKFRVLSLPCATGEEPYSIAMSLLDAGISPTRFEIDAIDLSPAAIAAAQRSEYGKNSFRGKDLGFRNRYFQPTDKGCLLDPAVRKLVQFQTGNLLDEKCLLQTGVYDFIFCRNLLIYFERTTQECALHKINRLLKETGVLFVGSAEVTIAAKNGFVSAHLPLSFACRKAPAESAWRNQPPQPVFVQPENQANSVPKPPPLPFGNLPPVAQGETADLNQARQLANEGRLVEAAEICEVCLRKHGASAEVYYLLGLLRDATGAEAQAGEFYRKALYLEPNHYETLLQWASLSEKKGDEARARILIERAGRIKQLEPH